jgi:cytochrome P450
MPKRPIPSPPGRFLTGHLRDASRRPLEYVLEVTRGYGDVVQLRLGPSRLILVNHPDHVKRVLQEMHSHYGRPAFVTLLRKLVGNGLLFSEGDFWLRQRRIMQPSFHRERIANFASIMARAVTDRVQRWRTQASAVDLIGETNELIAAINGPALFANDITQEAPELGPAIRELLGWLNQRTLHPVAAPLFIPTAENKRFIAAKRLFTETVQRLIAERRAAGQEGFDLLSMLLGARDAESGESMSDQQLQDEVFTFLIAGLETTTAALQWTLIELSQHPEALQRVREEQRRVCGSEPPQPEQLSLMPYTRMVIDETLRLHPPVFGLTRRVVSEDTIAGYSIPKGVQLLVSPYALHRHPGIWSEPDSFAPERHFAPEHVQARSRFAYIPFGAGPRQCIGNAFAMMELQVIVPTLAAAFDFSLTNPQAVEAETSMTLRPKAPLHMHVQPVSEPTIRDAATSS